MSEHKATIRWSQSSADFRTGKYSREHTWAFDGGLTVPASASPQVVRVPWSNPANVDPEEAYIASLSSCHMLTFLWLAQRAGFVITSYVDEAVGVMQPNEANVLWVAKVTLRVTVVYEGRKPAKEEEEHLHHQAHGECFIANSVKTEVVVETVASVEG